MYIENPIYFKRNVILFGILSLILQGGLLALLSIRSQAGNFAFLLYILIVLFSVLVWVFLFWRSVEIARSFTVRVEEGVVSIRRGFILKETLRFPANEITALSVRGKGEFATVTLYLNARKIVLPFQPVFLVQEILAELPSEGGNL